MAEGAPEFLKLDRSWRRKLTQRPRRKPIVRRKVTPYIGLLTLEPKPPLETPCIDVCEMDEGTGLCRGCGRTIDEIARWAGMSPEERRGIMAALPARMAPRERVRG